MERTSDSSQPRVAAAREPRGPVGSVKALVQQFQEDDVTGLGAELAFRWTLAVFPFGLFVAALSAFVAGWLGMANPTEQILAGLEDNLPPELASTVAPELERVIGEQRPGLASFGAILALWSATGGTMAAIKAMNRAYDVEETRPIVGRYILAILLTLGGAVALIGAFVTIVGGSLLTEQVVEQIGLDPQVWSVVSLLRWPLVLVLLAAGTAVLYRVGPNVRPTWGTAFLGGLVFALGWLIATFAFGLYVSNVADYGATYGALGSAIAFLFWMYITGIVLVVGAEVAAIVTAHREPERLRAQGDAPGSKTIGRARETVATRVREAREEDEPGAAASH